MLQVLGFIQFIFARTNKSSALSNPSQFLCSPRSFDRLRTNNPFVFDVVCLVKELVLQLLTIYFASVLSTSQFVHHHPQPSTSILTRVRNQRLEDSTDSRFIILSFFIQYYCPFQRSLIHYARHDPQRTHHGAGRLGIRRAGARDPREPKAVQIP